jgi:hypothetical protein
MTIRRLKFAAASAFVLFALTSESFAITAEVARKCTAALAKEFPRRVVGNPASGSAKGSGRQQQAYYQQCVANGARPPESSSQK